MPANLLPPDIRLHSKEPVLLRFDPVKAIMVPDKDPLFPGFFLYATEEFLARMGWKEQSLQLTQYGRNWPAHVSDQGLCLDPQWNVFQAFFPGSVGARARVALDVVAGEVHWNMRCPGLSGPETILGRLIHGFGASAGATPVQKPDHPPVPTFPKELQNVLAVVPDKDLRTFLDRTETMLDLAMQAQMWDCAEHLWQRGVRPGAKALEGGVYLQSLVLATYHLQDSSVYGFVEEHLRPKWLDTWLARHDELGAALPQSPSLTWRAQALDYLGEDCHPGLVDTPQSFWITKFLNAFSPLSFPHPNQQTHKTLLVERWVDFWSDHGVDLEQVAIQMPSSPTYYNENRTIVGMSQYYQRQDFDCWKEMIQLRQDVRQQVTSMEQSTPPAPKRRNLPRL